MYVPDIFINMYKEIRQKAASLLGGDTSIMASSNIALLISVVNDTVSLVYLAFLRVERD